MASFSIIFGLGTSGLFLLRQLAKLDTNIVCIGREDDIGFNSKYGIKYIAKSSESIKNVVEETCNKSTAKPKGYICSDQYLTILTEEYPEVFNKIEFIGPDLDTYRLINNKDRILKYCKDLDFNIPKEFQFEEISLLKSEEFPIIIKWNSKQMDLPKNPIGKTKIINSIEDFNLVKNLAISHKIDLKQLFGQTYISGDNSSQYSFGGYFYEGVELAGIVVNQIRQFPQGVSSFVKEIENKEIEKQIRNSVTRFAKSLKYTGFLEMEFKIDSKSGILYLLDINPRPWGWVSILDKKYKNFYMILESQYIKLEKSNLVLSWANFARDIVSALKNPWNSKRENESFLNSYLSNNLVFDIFDKNDLKPTLSIPRTGIVKLVKKRRKQNNEEIS